MATQAFATSSTEEFGDRRVFIQHNVAAAAMNGSTANWGQSSDGPIQVFVSRSTSEAAIAYLADRHGIGAQELRAFCANGKPSEVVQAMVH
jgi:hypothetical protein